MKKVVGIHLPSLTGQWVTNPRAKPSVMTMTINPDRIVYEIELDDLPPTIARAGGLYPGFKLVSFTGGPPEQGWLIKE